MNEKDILLYDNVPIKIAAQYLGVSQQYIRIGLQRQRLPFGSAVQVGGTNTWTYQISPGAIVNWKNGNSIRNYYEMLIKKGGNRNEETQN